MPRSRSFRVVPGCAAVCCSCLRGGVCRLDSCAVMTARNLSLAYSHLSHLTVAWRRGTLLRDLRETVLVVRQCAGIYNLPTTLHVILLVLSRGGGILQQSRGNQPTPARRRAPGDQPNRPNRRSPSHRSLAGPTSIVVPAARRSCCPPHRGPAAPSESHQPRPQVRSGPRGFEPR